LKFLFAGLRSTWLLGDASLARSLLWAARGELSWYPHVRGFTGLVRRLEGAVSARHDLLEDGQLQVFVAGAPSTLLWASVLDMSVSLDDHPSVAANSNIDLARVFRRTEDSNKRLFWQFSIHVEPEEDDDGFISDRRQGGWALKSRVRVDLIASEGLVVPLSFVLDELTQLSLRIRVNTDDVESILVAKLGPSAPGVPHLVSVEFGPNWTCRVQVDKAASLKIVIPERLRDEISFEHLTAVELRSNMRAALRHVLITSNATLAAEAHYFAGRRVAAIRDAHSLGSGAQHRTGSSISWTSLFVAVAVLVGGPLLVARLAAFDSGLIPKKVANIMFGCCFFLSWYKHRVLLTSLFFIFALLLLPL
jgi:hypothetical protein